MSIRSSALRSIAAIVGAGAMILASAGAEAAMSPPLLSQSPNNNVHHVWCAVGVNLLFLGGCLAGGPGPRYYAGANPPRGCPAGYHLGPQGRRCWPN
jgi:hypothetical protein